MRRLAAMLLLSVLVAPSLARADAPAFQDWPQFYRAFRDWSLDSSRVAAVSSVLLERDAGTLALEQGQLVMAAPLGGRVSAAVFRGQGTFQFTPRSEIERQQLRRFFGVTTLRRRFTGLTLVFADSTAEELAPALQGGAPARLGAMHDTWETARHYLTWRNLQTVRPEELARTLIEGERNGLFWAEIEGEDGKRLFFMLDPSARERVKLLKTRETESYGLLKLYRNEVVSQCFAAGDPDTVREDHRPAFRVTHYTIDARIHDDLRLDASADVELLGCDRPRRWLAFSIQPDLHVDSVRVGADSLQVFQQKDDDEIWVRCEPPLQPDERRTLRFVYHGKALEREGDWIALPWTTGWYPSAAGNPTWDIRYHYPRELQLVGTGERIEDRIEGRQHYARWVMRRPFGAASFDVNFLRGIDVPQDTLPALTVWMRHLNAPGAVRKASTTELAGAKDDDSRVAHDLARCAAFYQRAFGPPLQHGIQAVETPLDVFEGYPGVVHMMLEESRAEPGPEWTTDRVRAHEMAHQWWGLNVQPATYHDWWLSEAFANFSAIWYFQCERRDARSYFDMLGEWKREILENRKFLLGDGQQAGPIWLGPRTASSTTPGDYHVVIYHKGAWVLHMLRNYLLDPATQDESRFQDLMRDFYQTSAGRRVFTEDFRHAVERATGEDMGWFFEQWVYGTDVPTWRFRWTAEPVEGGRWKIHGHVEQQNVPESFHMPAFVRVEFGKQGFARQRVWVRGPVTDFDLPLAPEKPTRVILNDLESVLAEVVNETR